MTFIIAQKITKSGRIYTNKKSYITAKIVLLDFEMVVKIKDTKDSEKLIKLNQLSNRLISGKGYTFHKGEWIKFIGLKGTTYNTVKSLYRYKPGDIVKGTIINNEFYIK